MLACYPSAGGDLAESLLQTAPLWQGSCIGPCHSRQHTGHPRPLVQLAARAMHLLSLYNHSDILPLSYHFLGCMPKMICFCFTCKMLIMTLVEPVLGARPAVLHLLHRLQYTNLLKVNKAPNTICQLLCTHKLSIRDGLLTKHLCQLLNNTNLTLLPTCIQLSVTRSKGSVCGHACQQHLA